MECRVRSVVMRRFTILFFDARFRRIISLSRPKVLCVNDMRAVRPCDPRRRSFLRRLWGPTQRSRRDACRNFFDDRIPYRSGSNAPRCWVTATRSARRRPHTAGSGFSVARGRRRSDSAGFAIAHSRRRSNPAGFSVAGSGSRSNQTEFSGAGSGRRSNPAGFSVAGGRRRSHTAGNVRGNR